MVTVDGERLVRCFLRRVGDDLVIETNSVERIERVLSTLRDLVPDLEIREDRRLSPAQARSERPVGSGPPGEIPPEVADAVAAFVREKEDAWVDERVPALGGLSPREAAGDPTRREDLLSLLREFDRRSAPRGDKQLIGFDGDRLRERLGLTD
jgi:hypothetical protein